MYEGVKERFLGRIIKVKSVIDNKSCPAKALHVIMFEVDRVLNEQQKRVTVAVMRPGEDSEHR